MNRNKMYERLDQIDAEIQEIRKELNRELKIDPRRLIGHISSTNPCNVIIDVQTHRRGDFTPGGSIYHCSNGVILNSVARPGYQREGVVFTRGRSITYDETEIECPSPEEAIQVLVAFREYTARFGEES